MGVGVQCVSESLIYSFRLRAWCACVSFADLGSGWEFGMRMGNFPLSTLVHSSGAWVVLAMPLRVTK